MDYPLVQNFMNGYWKWAHVNPVLTICVLFPMTAFFLYSVIALIFKLFNRIIRCVTILLRGWPPAHLDADGDFRDPRAGK